MLMKPYFSRRKLPDRPFTVTESSHVDKLRVWSREANLVIKPYFKTKQEK